MELNLLLRLGNDKDQRKFSNDFCPAWMVPFLAQICITSDTKKVNLVSHFNFHILCENTGYTSVSADKLNA